MKRLFAFLALGCVIAMSLTSCLKSDDNNQDSGLTKAQITQCYNAVRGDFSGEMIFPVLNDDRNGYDTDTVDIDWTVTADTMLIVRELPAMAVAGTISDNTLRQALEEQNPVSDVKCYIGFYGIDTYVKFYLAPQKTDFQVYLNDKTHTVSVVFWANPYYSYTSLGYKDLTSGLVAAQIVMGGVYLDNNESTNYLGTASSTAVPLIFATDISKATAQQSN